MELMDIRIVNYETKYLDAIRAINVAVSSHPNRPADEKELCRHLYIDYYAFYSAENCFVALDKNDHELHLSKRVEKQGYIEVQDGLQSR